MDDDGGGDCSMDDSCGGDAGQSNSKVRVNRFARNKFLGGLWSHFKENLSPKIYKDLFDLLYQSSLLVSPLHVNTNTVYFFSFTSKQEAEETHPSRVSKSATSHYLKKPSSPSNNYQ
jgi:hypothetical protein